MPVNALGQRFSPWSVIDDDGDSVLALNAFPDRRPARLYKRSPATDRVLALQYESESREDHELIRSLVEIGVLLEPNERGPDAPVYGGDGHNESTPYLNEVKLEVESVGASVRQLHELLKAVRILLSAKSAPTLTLICVNPESPAEVGACQTAVLKAIREAKLDERQVRWAIEHNRVEPLVHYDSLLSKQPQLTIYLEDTAEVDSDFRRADALRDVEVLAKRGYVIRPLIVTRGQQELLDAVTSWQQSAGFAGVSVRLAVLACQIRGFGSPMSTLGEFASAQESLLAVPRILQSTIHRSEPWATIIRSAVVPGARKQRSTKRRSNLFLSSEGRWARTRFHAKAHLTRPLESLVTNTTALEVMAANVGDGERIWPDCAACAFAPLCDGYWSPEQDVLQRTGHGERARMLAQLQCALRKDILFMVLSEIRSCLRPSGPRPRTQAVFKDGRLTITAGVVQ